MPMTWKPSSTATMLWVCDWMRQGGCEVGGRFLGQNVDYQMIGSLHFFWDFCGCIQQHLFSFWMPCAPSIAIDSDILT